MFDRGLNASGERSRIAVQLLLSHGETITAQISVAQGGRLIDALNRPEPFLEVELAEGGTRILSRQGIASITPIHAPKADELSRAQKAMSFDPLQVLGLAAGATAEEIRAAFLQRVKAYHPDKFTGLGLPREVEDYASSMLQRINAAYQALAPRSLAA